MARQPRRFLESLRAPTSPDGNGQHSRSELERYEWEQRQADLARRYHRWRPWFLRLNSWASTWVLSRNDRDPEIKSWPRNRKFRRMLVELLPRAYKLYRALRSKRIDPTERLGICLGDEAHPTCSRLRTKLPRIPVTRGGREKYYCTQCGCPDYPLSELRFKATLDEATCPANLWPRDDWESAYVAEVEKQRYDHARKLRRATAPAEGDSGDGCEDDNLDGGGRPRSRQREQLLERKA